MPKILKDTIKKIPSKQSLRIYKKSNSPNYYCSFYVGYSTMKSGKKEKTLRTKNVKEEYYAGRTLPAIGRKQ